MNSADNMIIRRMAAGNDDPAKTAWMSVHIPHNDNNDRTAVIICPGGGYEMLADSHEGVDCAGWMNTLGVVAFVLRYRLAPEFHHPCQMEDAQWAIRYVRSNADVFGINPHRIGIWGFSAGGHLASTVATQFECGDPSAESPLLRVSSRPDFLILAYPVISMAEPLTHIGSRDNLLGTNAPPDLVEALSNELHVTSDTPPTFIFHTDSDDAVPAENSVRFYLALRKAKAPAEMHIYAEGPHGVGMGVDYPFLKSWPKLLENWMIGSSLMEESSIE